MPVMAAITNLLASEHVSLSKILSDEKIGSNSEN